MERGWTKSWNYFLYFHGFQYYHSSTFSITTFSALSIPFLLYFSSCLLFSLRTILRVEILPSDPCCFSRFLASQNYCFPSLLYCIHTDHNVIFLSQYPSSYPFHGSSEVMSTLVHSFLSCTFFQDRIIFPLGRIT